RLFKESSRERYLTAEEMPRFLAALDKERNVDLRDFVYLALLTGVRSGDIQSAKWEQIDLERATWKIPNPKNGKAYEVALVPKVIEVLQARPRTSAEWVFPSWGVSGHRKAPKAAWNDFCTRC